MKPRPNAIRSKMIKHPNCYLWDKTIWTKQDLNYFNQRLNIPENRFKIAVIRLSDGKVYESIKLCRLENKICKKTMFKKLKDGTEYQRATPAIQ
jgi:hypothetical protein